MGGGGGGGSWVLGNNKAVVLKGRNTNVKLVGWVVCMVMNVCMPALHAHVRVFVCIDALHVHVCVCVFMPRTHTSCVCVCVYSHPALTRLCV